MKDLHVNQAKSIFYELCKEYAYAVEKRNTIRKRITATSSQIIHPTNLIKIEHSVLNLDFNNNHIKKFEHTLKRVVENKNWTAKISRSLHMPLGEVAQYLKENPHNNLHKEYIFFSLQACEVLHTTHIEFIINEINSLPQKKSLTNIPFPQFG